MPDYFKREDKAADSEIPYEDMPVKAWRGKMVRVIGLSAKEAMAFGKGMITTDVKGNIVEATLDNVDNMMGNLLVLTLTDDKFEKIFKPEDAEWIGNQPALVIKPLFEKAMILSGMKEKAVETAVKNSEATPESALPTA